MTKLEVIDFYADWCGPCKAMSPAIEALMEEYSAKEGVEIRKSNVDAEPDMAKDFNVRGIPTLVFMKDGVEAYRVSGVQTKSKISEMIEEILAN
jgi:thioredoxin